MYFPDLFIIPEGTPKSPKIATPFLKQGAINCALNCGFIINLPVSSINPHFLFMQA